jgi:hypothetical protein
MSEVETYNRETDIPEQKPVPAGYFDAIVAGAKREITEKDFGSIPAGTSIRRISYRLKSDDPDLNGRYVRPFPIPDKNHKDAWKWFDWCERMGYDTKNGFQFNEDDVVNTEVTLKFDPPQQGKDGQWYDRLASVERKV